MNHLAWLTRPWTSELLTLTGRPRPLLLEYAAAGQDRAPEGTA